MADEEDGSIRLKRGMAQILSELEGLFSKDQIGAVSIAIALRSGDVRHLMAHDDGFRIMLIAAAAIAQREIIESAAKEPDAGNWMIAAPRGQT